MVVIVVADLVQYEDVDWDRVELVSAFDRTRDVRVEVVHLDFVDNIVEVGICHLWEEVIYSSKAQQADLVVVGTGNTDRSPGVEAFGKVVGVDYGMNAMGMVIVVCLEDLQRIGVLVAAFVLAWPMFRVEFERGLLSF